jgi:hypothetical protein
LKSNEQEDTDGLRSGDQRILDKVYRDNYSSIVRLVTNSFGSEEEAKGIYQYSVLSLVKKKSQSDFKFIRMQIN